jgi:hypothetical protein
MSLVAGVLVLIPFSSCCPSTVRDISHDRYTTGMCDVMEMQHFQHFVGAWRQPRPLRQLFRSDPTVEELEHAALEKLFFSSLLSSF